MHRKVIKRFSLKALALVVGCGGAANEPSAPSSTQAAPGAVARGQSEPVAATPAGTAEAAAVGATEARVEPSPNAQPYEFPSGLLVSGDYREPALEVPAGTTVLHVGDSFAGALGIELNKVLKARGVQGYLKFKVPSYIPGWASGRELPEYIAKYQPDLVLITLGANEMEIGEPEQRAPTIRKLVARLGDRPCVWIAPALWGKDNGLMEIVRQNVAPCRYLDTNALIQRMPRAGDKIHPQMGARPDWAEFVLRWLARERVGAPGKPWALRPESGSPG